MTSATRCPSCGSGEVSEAGGYSSKHSAFAGLKRVACTNCGLHFSDPMPSEGLLESYNASYFDNAHGGAAEKPDERAFFSGIAALRIAHVERYTNEHRVSVSSVLEVGPGAGDFAGGWLKRHPMTSYFAIETDTTCHAALEAAGIKLLSRDANLPKIDLIVLSHVLEHVPNPTSFLSTLTRELRPGGAVFIEVPCNDWQHKEVVEPHLLFFDKKPMAALLETLGLQALMLSYHGKTISDLKAQSTVSNFCQKVRSRLIRLGLTRPFATPAPGMESLATPLERAVMRPWDAHLEKSEPAWWLRALAIKP